MNTKELKQILENHRHWLMEDCEGWEDMRANLRYADLSDADLSNANLYNANLSNANLRYADLSDANLRYADLSNANLYNANLSNANLYNANLSNANLRYADLSDANLRYADLSNANLYNAHHLDEVTGLYLPTTCPSDGEFTAWKKCSDGNVAKLLIPAYAKRTSATGRKCRASEAVVLALYDRDGNEISEAYSMYDSDFVYRVGETVKPSKPFDENRWNECASGIHFFVTREEAERY